MDIFEAFEKANAVMAAATRSMIPVTAKKVGLDPRISIREMYASKQGLLVRGETRALNYYGGFEYVDSDCVTVVGDWTLYSSDCSRVRECLYEVLPASEVSALRAQWDEIEEEDE